MNHREAALAVVTGAVMVSCPRCSSRQFELPIHAEFGVVCSSCGAFLWVDRKRVADLLPAKETP